MAESNTPDFRSSPLVRTPFKRRKLNATVREDVLCSCAAFAKGRSYDSFSRSVEDLLKAGLASLGGEILGSSPTHPRPLSQGPSPKVLSESGNAA